MREGQGGKTVLGRGNGMCKGSEVVLSLKKLRESKELKKDKFFSKDLS